MVVIEVDGDLYGPFSDHEEAVMWVTGIVDEEEWDIRDVLDPRDLEDALDDTVAE